MGQNQNMTNKPKILVQIDVDEWWFLGCFIQKQIHPQLKPYHVFKDSEAQETIGACNTFAEAKKMCVLNKNTNYKLGYMSFF